MKSRQVALTICIPTYNRPSILNTVQTLWPQLGGRAAIKIFDNCSDVPVSDILRDYVGESVEIVRGRVNVGAAGNIIKCFEYCDSEWMWLLSDDDLPAADAVDVIINTINQHPDVVYVKYNSNVGRVEENCREEIISTGQQQFIANCTNFSNLLFISSTVYKVTEIRQASKAAYYFTHTFSPQIPFILSYLAANPEATTLFSPQVIVRGSKTEELGHATWSSLTVDKALSDFVFAVQGAEARKMLFKKINVYHPFQAALNGLGVLDQVKAIVLAKEDGEEHNLLADYLASNSFIYWATAENSHRFLAKAIFVSALTYVLYIPIVNKLFRRLIKTRAGKTHFYYNRYALFNRDERL